VIYEGDPAPREVFFRVLIFKIFNRIDTWRRLVDIFGEVRCDDYRFAHYDDVLTSALKRGDAIYSSAYIMPSGGRASGHARKHQMHLRLVERMVADDVPAQLANSRRMRDAFELLRSYPTIGDFLAYQYVTDINYSTLTNFKENAFTIPGPGARDGIRKCFQSLGGLTEADIIRLTADRQEEEFARLGLTFSTLWGRPLQYIDCQNLFCEVDKYARVRHPEAMGASGRSRIKHRFRPHASRMMFFYPPKWGINHKVDDACRRHSGFGTTREDDGEIVQSTLWPRSLREEETT
jgi:hypothetical protein